MLTFAARLERDPDGTWWYVHVPREVRLALKQHERRGTVPVIATIGGSSWDASLMPWADGSAQLVVKRAIRERERLAEGSELSVSVRARAKT